MKKIDFVRDKLEKLLEIGIVCAEELENSKYNSTGYQEYNPVYCSKELQKLLVSGANQQERPYIYKDQYQVYFACLKYNKIHYLLGPMCISMLDRVELHKFYHDYGIVEEKEKRLKQFTISRVLEIVELMASQLLNREYSDEELIYVNHIVKDDSLEKDKEQVFFEIQENDEEIFHHTYYEERKLLEFVREGRVEEAVAYSKNMDVELGRLSKKELNHWKNVAIVAITLCTRAAIEGGISPSTAYRLSDFYIQKSDNCVDIAQVISYRNRAVEELTSRVKMKQQTRSGSNYVEQCKEYVEKHYREKIYLEDMAKALGISAGYLSKLFHREMEVRLQDYIVKVRVEHAANLLMFSEESIARIAEYVNFPSQSYFGKAFKEYKNMSPKKYRELNKPFGF